MWADSIVMALLQLQDSVATSCPESSRAAGAGRLTRAFVTLVEEAVTVGHGGSVWQGPRGP